MVSPTIKNNNPKKNSEVLVPVDKIDRVGNIEQKELALSSANLKRIGVYRRIKEMLDAVEVREEIHDGQIKKIEEPDMSMRARGVELALKAFGDLKEFDRAVNNVTHNKVVYQWLAMDNSVVVQPTAMRISDVRD